MQLYFKKIIYKKDCKKLYLKKTCIKIIRLRNN